MNPRGDSLGSLLTSRPSVGFAEVHRKSPSKSQPGSKAGGAGVGTDKAAEDNSGFGPIMGPVDAFGLKIYPWHPESNAYFMFSNTECIAMGGGGAFALYLDKDFLHGVSGPCETFGSDILASSEDFIISDIEFWVFEGED